MQLKNFLLGDTVARYLIDDNQNVALQLLPRTLADKTAAPWDNPEEPFDPRRKYTHNWQIGSLVHLHLAHQSMSRPGMSMHDSANAHSLKLQHQVQESTGDGTQIVTTLVSAEGYEVVHTLRYRDGLRGLEINTAFRNGSNAPVTLDMLSSFVMDGLSPFRNDDNPDVYRLHRFYAGWSLEGVHSSQSIEELGLEKSWVSWLISDNAERWGSQGCYPVDRFFPTAVFEDEENHVFWGAQIAHNATWQMELGRLGDYLSFAGGLGDRHFCGWKKNVAVGERFDAPTAYVAVATECLDNVCHALTDMQKPARKQYGEVGVPTSFNEYCATWGTPTQEKMMQFADCLQEFGIKYLVIDAGWCKAGLEQAGNGEWTFDTSIFPDAKEMCRILRERGIIPGIWLEFECTTSGSALFEPEYDHMKLQRDGHVVTTHSGTRSFWDMRRDDVKEHLYNKVIAFLKEYGFGYIKVDYNGNIGPHVDGAESQAEALRQHAVEARRFFERMKQEIPDLIIENCASGGHRLEPSMMGASAVSSFSDAHESIEIPCIAANLHRLMLPAQELIWATLHGDDSDDRLVYSLASVFLGRVCLSGPMTELNTAQRAIVKAAMDFYAKLTDIIENGDTTIVSGYGTSLRHPRGTQAVVRRTATEALVVCHAFDNPKTEELCIDLGTEAEIVDSFYGDAIRVEHGKVYIPAMREFTAAAILLTLKGE